MNAPPIAAPTDQVRLRLTTITQEFNEVAREVGLLPIKLTRFYRDKVEAEMRALGHTDGPLCRGALSKRERLQQRVPGEVADFVNDRDNMPPTLGASAVRKYKNRMLFFPTSTCLGHCQYCFRTDVLSEQHEAVERSPEEQLAALVLYLQEHPEVQEVILSGGDPLALPPSQLREILHRLRQETALSHIRIHTRALAFAPSVFSDAVCTELANARVRLVHHVVHPYELCDTSRACAERLRAHGVHCYNQFPLLCGINDHSAVLTRLLKELDELWIRNLSIFIPDPIKYSLPYRIPLARIFAIIDELNLSSPAWINSTRLVLDTSHGKVRRENLASWDVARGVAIFTRDGQRIEYPDLPTVLDSPGDLRQLLWMEAR